MDRFAEKFPWQSPYVHAGNNSVNYVDLRGDSIWIRYYDADNQPQRILYTQGMKYEGDPFVSSVVESLNHLAETGAMKIDFGDGNKVDVLEAFSKEINVYIETKDRNQYDPSGSNKIGFANTGIEFQKKEGIADKGYNSPSAALGHEFIHAYRHNFATKSFWENMGAAATTPPWHRFDTYEEQLTTTNWANQINTALGQDTRFSHKGTPYKTVSPTSTVRKP